MWALIRKHKERSLKTACLLLACLMHGLQVGATGPALLDLGQQVHSDLTAVSFMLTAETAGYVTGAIVNSVLYPRINFQVATGVIWLCLSLLTMSVPFLTELWALLLVSTLIGAGKGLFETGRNVFISRLWGIHCLPFRQTMQLVVGCGGALSPLVLQPFLVHRNNTSSNSTNEGNTGIVNLVPPYAVFTSLFAFTSIFAIIVWRLYPETEEFDSLQTRAVQEQEDGPTKTQFAHSTTSISMIGAVLVTCFAIVGIEVTIHGYVTAFVVKSDLHLPSTRGAQLASFYFAIQTLVQVTAVFYLPKVGIRVNLIAIAIMLLSANEILVPFGGNEERFLWLGLAVMGIATPTTIPCLFGFMEQFFPVTSLISSLVSLATTPAGLSFPTLVSHLLLVDPKYFLYVTACCSVVAVATLVVTLLLGRRQRSQTT